MKRVRSNSKKVRNAVDAHVLENVLTYEEKQFETVREAYLHLYSEFNRVANHQNNIKRIPNNQERFADYMAGAPHFFPVYNWEIIDTLESWGLVKKDATVEQSIHLYRYLIFAQMMKYVNP